jgi:bifunctional UDP-N-acetylglucosamine pyrophosphorylase/glucosamine-1-phosphate N-acetyltransferase
VAIGSPRSKDLILVLELECLDRVEGHRSEDARDRETKAELFVQEFLELLDLAWGRLIRGKDGMIEKIVEQKNATEEEKSVTLINPGFYCVRFDFAKTAIRSIQKNPVSHEYYLTDIVEIARRMGEVVVDLEVPFAKVGIGINTPDELQSSQKLYSQTRT